MDAEIWNKMCDEVLERMSAHVEPYLSPIKKFEKEDDVRHHGTGSYIEYCNTRFLITNEHVAKYYGFQHLTHSFNGSDNICILKNKFISEKAPIDVAICKIDQTIWENEPNNAQAIPLDRFSLKHESVPGELLFFAGFSGERSKEVFGTLFSRGTYFLTVECPLPESVENAAPDYHLAIPYPAELARSTDPSIPLPNPHGFSGSLLWNTKRMECLQNRMEWHPSMATVTGIIWGWPSSTVCVLATKVECLELKEMIEAYDSII